LGASDRGKETVVRSAAHPCPVKWCSNTLPFRTAACCRTCWAKLPDDKREAFTEAKKDRAPHRVGYAVIDVCAWLNAHPPGAVAARMLGEAPP